MQGFRASINKRVNLKEIAPIISTELKKQAQAKEQGNKVVCP
jgi:hypothetical protein